MPHNLGDGGRGQLTRYRLVTDGQCCVSTEGHPLCVCLEQRGQLLQYFLFVHLSRSGRIPVLYPAEDNPVAILGIGRRLENLDFAVVLVASTQDHALALETRNSAVFEIGEHHHLLSYELVGIVVRSDPRSDVSRSAFLASVHLLTATKFLLPQVFSLLP